MFIKRKRLTPGGNSNNESKEARIENPGIEDVIDEINSSIKEAEKQSSRERDCGCFRYGRTKVN